ncbi:MAG: DUF5615 family PIN-like protein [Blastocatellales bacterium]
MRFLVDECAGPKVAEWLLQQQHEVFSVFHECRGMDDEMILEKAVAENRILITADKDFGEMVYRQRRQHCGVIFIRLDDQRALAKISALKSLLENYADQLPDRFIVVTETRVRFARNQSTAN